MNITDVGTFSSPRTRTVGAGGRFGSYTTRTPGGAISMPERTSLAR